ncbi:hypothetical protein HN587_06300 [Candidatus Woesearchaeota archaeon]|jgi:hypothetical protein|nr:hypothetical protein [Candidatus Woesearchaeota archaeon]
MAKMPAEVLETLVKKFQKSQLDFVELVEHETKEIAEGTIQYKHEYHARQGDHYFVLEDELIDHFYDDNKTRRLSLTVQSAFNQDVLLSYGTQRQFDSKGNHVSRLLRELDKSDLIKSDYVLLGELALYLATNVDSKLHDPKLQAHAA